MSYVLLICGGRNLDEEKVFNFLQNNFDPSLVHRVVAGKAKGADRAAIKWAKKNFINYSEFPADWDKYGDNAGPIRNVEMLKVGKPDLVISFPGGTGTKHMVTIASAKKVPVLPIMGDFEREKSEKEIKRRWKSSDS